MLATGKMQRALRGEDMTVDSHLLWFERLYVRLRVPFLLGAPVLGSLAFLAILAICYALAGLWGDFLSLSVFFVSVPMVFVLLSQIASRYASRQMQKLLDYSRSINQESRAVSIQPLYDVRGVLFLVVIFLVTIQPLYVLAAPRSYTLFQSLLTEYVPWIYFEFFVASLVWVMTYSSLSVYRMGKLPMMLKPFVEDHTLGLRPFASVALRLAAITVVAFAFLVYPQVLIGVASGPIIATQVLFTVISVAFFILPLTSLHAKLVKAKREELTWIVQRYTGVLQRFKVGGTGSLDSGLLAELMAAKDVLSDVQQIRTWPFDTGILLRLAAILLSVTTIILARVIQLALHF